MRDQTITERGSKPNVLVITADQWRGDCLSSVGHACVRTPNVDALAKDGTLFRRHYAGAAPCSPARATLYTGLYQMNHRVCRNGSPLDRRFDNLALAARRGVTTRRCSVIRIRRPIRAIWMPMTRI